MGFNEYAEQFARYEQLVPELLAELKLSELTPQLFEEIGTALGAELMKRQLEKGEFTFPEIAKGEMSNAMLQEADGLGALFLVALASEVVAGSLSNIKLPELTQMTYKVTFTATYDKSVKKGNNFLI